MTALSAAKVEAAAPPTTTDPRDPRDPRTRLSSLFDMMSFRAMGAEDSAGVLAGAGRIEGIPAVAFATDPRAQGGAMGALGCGIIVRAYEMAARERVPIVGMWHSGGARLREGAESLHAVGQVFAAMTRASGVIPQISVVLGPAAGGAAYGPALTDVVVLSSEGRIFVTGPDVVRSVTGEDVDMASLGGPEPHGRRSGVAHVVTSNAADAVRETRRIAGLLGGQGQVRMAGMARADFSDIIPESPRRAYDVRPLIGRLLDQPGTELHPRWAPNIVTTLGRLGGRTVGVIANNPLRLGGCLDARAAEKAARFVRMCDSLGVPLVILVDVPGYLPGVAQEWDGIVRRGAKLLHAFAEATVTRVTVITRKAYGGAYIAMNSRALGATRVLAWPTAEIAVMGSVPAVRILQRRRLAEAPESHRATLETELAAEHQKETGGLDRALAIGVIDEVIAPETTRSAISRIIAAGGTARGNHGNIPL